jgi:hypothetical protein
MDPTLSAISEESSPEAGLLENYDKTSFHRQQRLANHNVVAQACHVMIAIIVLLIIVLTIGRAGVPTPSVSGLKICSLNPAETLHPQGSDDREPHHTVPWKDCGHSGEEARAKGCVFDVVLVAWLQPECFDSELHEAYLSNHNYPFWLDRNLTKTMTLEEVRLGKHDTVYSSAEFHLVHCAYFLEHSIRGFRKGGMVDNVTLDNEHTEHCARSLRDHWLPEIGFSPLHTDYHSCGMR